MTRELTKLYETVRRDTLGSLSARFAEEGPPKGEIVVIIGAATTPERTADSDATLDAPLVRTALERHSIKDAASLVADETGQPRRLVYARALVLARGDA